MPLFWSLLILSELLSRDTGLFGTECRATPECVLRVRCQVNGTEELEKKTVQRVGQWLAYVAREVVEPSVCKVRSSR
jgi:hypothetical protein